MSTPSALTPQHHRPLCPCCMQAFSSSILAGEATGTPPPAAATKNPANDDHGILRSPFMLCGTCAPSDVERALARKAQNKDDPSTVPPIVWYLTPSEIETQTQKVLEETTANLDAIAAVPLSEVTFDNTVAKLMTPPNYKTNPAVAACKFLQHCSVDPAMREAATKAGSAFAASRVQGRMRKDVYERVKAFAAAPQAKELDSYKQHFVQASLRDFERAGLALSEDDGQQLKQLLEEDAAVCSQFGANLAGDTTKLFFAPEELEGCGDDFIQARLNKDDGKCTITLKYPDIIPIGTNCVVAETRRQVTEAREGTNAYKNNLELVARGVAIRKQIATLLGYPSWAECICSQRMSGSYKAVDGFLTDLEGKLKPAGQENYNTLLALKEKHCRENPKGGTFDGKLNAWDTGFYNNLLLKTEYGVDAEQIKEYFPLDHVVQVTLDIYQELLSLVFTELPAGTFWSWHHQVRCFRVNDAVSQEQIGHFYLDLHPRDGKYGHAAIFHLVKRNGNQGAVDCMLCNLPASTADAPALLRHQNVVTFFHEFGHIMHGLLAEGTGNSTRLAKCPRDFVEAPSQMLENWTWQRSILQRLSKHYKTNEPLPEEMLQSMIRAKHVNVAFQSLRQIYLSRLDLSIHGPSPPSDADGLQALVDKLRPKITLVENPPGWNMLRSFGHLMNQYSASYYGYMWAEVISADMFAERFEKDCMDPKAGMDYRKMVLAPGGTHSITDHLTKFLGRPPSNEAFLKSRNIIS